MDQNGLRDREIAFFLAITAAQLRVGRAGEDSSHFKGVGRGIRGSWGATAAAGLMHGQVRSEAHPAFQQRWEPPHNQPSPVR